MSIYTAAASGDAEQIFKSISASVEGEWNNLYRAAFGTAAAGDCSENELKQFVKDIIAITFYTPGCFPTETDRERWEYIFNAFGWNEEVHIERALTGFELFKIDTSFGGATDRTQKAARGIAKKWLRRQIKILTDKYRDNMSSALLSRDEETTLELKVYLFAKEYYKQTEEDDERMSISEWLEVWTPKSLAEELRKHIVGQEQAIKEASLLLYNHCKRIADPEIKRGGCALFFGRSGTGKTEVFRWLERLSPREVPFVILDCTAITPPGYKGESIIEMLASKLASGTSSTCRPFVLMDEIDKIFLDRDDDGFLQEKAASLLKIIEGYKVTVQRERSKAITIDTSQCVFAMAGHCKDVLDELWNKRIKTIGFTGTVSAGNCAPAGMTYAEAFGKYGRIPREFLRRIESYTLLHSLSKEQILQALLLEDGYYNEALKKASRAGVKISIPDDLCERLAVIAAEYQLTLSEIGPAMLKAVDYHIYYDGDGEDCSIHLEDVQKYLFISEEERCYE